MEYKKDGSGDVTLTAIFLFVFKQWAEHPWRMMLVVILALSSALSDILVPVFAADFVNVLTEGGSPFLSFFMMMGLGAAGALLRQCLNLNIASLTLTMMSLAGARAFKQIQSLTADWHANGFAGSTVRQITRGMWALVAFNETLLAGLLPIGAMLIGSTVSVWLHWPMAGGVFGIGGVLFSIVAVLLTVLYVAPAARTGNAWDSRIGGALADALSCNSVVKAFGAEVREEERLARILAAWRRHTSWAWMRSNVNGGVQEIMLVALQTLVLGVLLLLWRRGVINVGDITFMLTTLFMLQGYLRRIGSNFRHLQRAMNELEAMVAFKRIPAEGRADDKGNAVTISRGEICFSDVDFSYSGSGVPRLYQKMNVIINAGERVGLVGYSGSGKSTFVRLIQRLYEVQGGKITIDGQDITRMQLASLRRQIATVPQEPLLFHRSLAENIAYAKPDATQDEIERAAKLAGIHTLIGRLPEGYDTLVGERGVKLSGGERQRVAIARAFLVDMPILILDEATSSLDNESEAHIQRSMNELMKNRTTLVIAHRLSTLRRMDRILVFSHGRIVEQGSHDELIAIESGVYRKLFERQQMTEKNTQSSS